MSMTEEKERKRSTVCEEAIKPHSTMMENLVQRIQRNEEDKRVFAYAAKVWRAKSSEKSRRRKRSQAKNKNDDDKETGKCFELFRQVVRRVCLLTRVFRKMREFAMEKGEHNQVSTGAMQLKDSVVSNDEQKDLLFDPNRFISRYQVSTPRWVRTACSLPPSERSTEQVQNIVNLMKQLKDFRKYSNKMLKLLAKIVRYERFGRRRVIVRKGHVGMCFYVIYSGSVGVVVGGDEDRAFENEERPANVLRKGDSFGELALVRRSQRTATVVCLENTEFLVIDKEDFFSSGIDRCSQEEMLSRYRFLKSMDLFKSWEDDLLKEVAEGGRNIEYLSDRVIEADSTQSEFIYIITKGTCNVLRLLDLTTQDYLNEQRNTISRNSLNTSIRSRSPYNSPTKSISKSSLPVYNDTYEAVKTPSDLSSRMSEISIDKRSRVTFGDGHSSYTSITSSDTTKSLKNIDKYKQHRKRRQSTPEFRHMKKVHKRMPVVFSQLQTSWYEEALRKPNAKNTLGLGAFIRVDSLSRGQIFGVKYLLHEDDQDFDCKRKFTLLSAGCEVIRLSKSVLKPCIDEMTINEIKKKMFSYQTDEELYVIFTRQNNWRCFREELVDHIAEYRQNVDKAFKERCVSIPKLPLIQRKCISRTQSPSEHWQKLLDDGHIKKGPRSTYSISPQLPLLEESTHSPFRQQRILSSRGSQRTLILTHGGSRVNKIQAATNCNLTNRKSDRKSVV